METLIRVIWIYPPFKLQIANRYKLTLHRGWNYLIHCPNRDPIQQHSRNRKFKLCRRGWIQTSKCKHRLCTDRLRLKCQNPPSYWNQTSRGHLTSDMQERVNQRQIIKYRAHLRQLQTQRSQVCKYFHANPLRSRCPVRCCSNAAIQQVQVTISWRREIVSWRGRLVKLAGKEIHFSYNQPSHYILNYEPIKSISLCWTKSVQVLSSR